MTTLDALHVILASILERSPLAIAFSGGLDSRFLAHMALKVAPGRVRLLHASGPHTTAAETAAAEQWAKEQSAEFFGLAVNPLDIPQVRENSRERCYHCKRGLFQELLRHAGNAVLVDGSNASDTQGYRPGLKALVELGIRSPLMEAGFTKPEIHAFAAATGLSRPWQRARPCLLTRFPYDMPLDESVLRELEVQEARVEHFLGSGPDVPDFRLRVISHAQFLLQLQSTDESLAVSLRQALPELQVELVEQVSGFFDKGALPL